MPGVPGDTPFNEKSPLLDIVDQKIKDLVRNTKDLCGI